MAKCAAVFENVQCDREQKNPANPSCATHAYHLKHHGEYRPIRNGSVLTARDAHGNKQCRGCFEWKAVTNFAKSSRLRDGLQSLCTPCSSATTLTSYYRTGGYSTEKKMKSRYGMTPEQYEQKFEEQNKGCAICGKLDKKKILAVDHDHGHCPGRLTCGECVRGLLCTKCNLALGMVDESKEVLLNMIAYIEKWSK